jgi:hypothetical protein
MNVPSNIGESYWFSHVRTTMPEYIRVIGRVVGEVYVKDIDKKIYYNKVLDISVTDANRSNDLINAIAKGWVDVIHGKHFLVKIQRHDYNTEISRDEAIQAQPLQQVQQVQQIDLSEIKNYVNQLMQTSTAAIIDQLKQLQPNNNVDKNVIDNIVNQITSKLTTVTVSKEQSAIKEVANSVFINLDQDKELKTNINGEIGTVTTQEDKKSKSIAKKLKTIK